MNCRWEISLLLAALTTVAPAADVFGADGACRNGVRSFYLENDLFYHTDRNYTSGAKLNWVSPDMARFEEAKCVPDWARPIDDALRQAFASFLSSKAATRNIVASIGQEIYTPGDRLRTDLVREDRPYAGWLYAGLSYNERRGVPDGRYERLDSLEARLGVVGPLSLARFSQNMIHDLRGFPRFLGWDNQLRNEPGAQLILERKYRFDRAPDGGRDMILHAGGSAGNVATYLNTGLELRWGTNIPDDFGSSPVRPAGNNTAPGSFPAGTRAMEGRGAHLFAAFDARAVARDIFLDGNTFVHSHRVHKRPLVADLSLGAAGFAYGWKFSYARVIRSREFDGGSGRHSYGSFTVSHSFD